MNNLVPTSPPRLPMPAGFHDPAVWRLLTDTLYPNAQTADSIIAALTYCKARGLDILRRPINIVSTWNSTLGKNTESFWLSINEIEITAARSGQWAGMDEPKWGPDITETFRGRRKTREGWRDSEIEITFPEFCSVTVHRLVGGMPRAFSEPVFWREAYGRAGGGSSLPNDMWTKRPRGQLHKVAKAASLRAAFPEEGDYAAEEMEDQATTELVPPPAPSPADNWRPPFPAGADTQGKQGVEGQDAGPPQQSEENVDRETGEVGPRDIDRGETEEPRVWCMRLLDFIRAETELEAVDEWVKANQAHITALSNEAPKLHTQLEAAINRHHMAIIERKEAEQGEQASEQEPPNEREQA